MKGISKCIICKKNFPESHTHELCTDCKNRLIAMSNETMKKLGIKVSRDGWRRRPLDSKK